MPKRGKKAKGPAQGAGPVAAQTPKQVPSKQAALQQSDSDSDDRLIIRFSRFDRGGPWCLSKATSEEITRVLEAVASFETMKVVEAFSGFPGKDYRVEALPRPPRDRLIELSLDDQAMISVLRLNGPGRLFGFRRGRHFYALWWDPHHEVYPSRLKHT